MNDWTRRRALSAGACSFFLISTLSARPLQAAADETPRPELVFKTLSNGVWQHTSTSKLPTGQWFPSNGLIVVGRSRVLMIDTAWTPDQTELVLARLKPIAATRPIDLFITHFHDDRMGGVAVTAANNIRSYAFAQTVALATQHKMGVIDEALAGEVHAFDLGDRMVEVFYPGPGHTRDNAVAYDSASKIVFGGCLMRGLVMKDLGNVADAEIAAWANSVARVAARYPETSLVVPGHGAAGEKNVFDHTISLARAKTKLL